MPESMYITRLALLGIMLGAPSGALCSEAIGRPLPQEPVAVPTKVSKLAQSRDAVEDAYYWWLNQNFRYDEILKLPLQEAKRRLNAAREANVKLHEANRRYHQEARATMQRGRDALTNLPKPSSGASGVYDAALDGLRRDLQIKNGQIDRLKGVERGPAQIAVRGLMEQKQRIQDLQLLLLEMKTHSEQVANSAKDAGEAIKKVVAFIDEAVVRYDQYARDDELAARAMEDVLVKYERAIEAAPRPAPPPPPPPPPAEETKNIRSQPGGGSIVDRVRERITGEARKKELAARLQRLVGRWRSSYAEADPRKGSDRRIHYSAKSCEVEIQEGGKGKLRCDFSKVPEGNRADVAFGFALNRLGPHPNSLVGTWLEGSSSGDLTVSLQGDNTLKVEWHRRTDGGEFFIADFGPAELKKD